MKTKVPARLKDIILRTGHVSDLDSIPLDTALGFEFQSTYKTAVKDDIPSMSIVLEKIDTETLGELLGLFQYIAFYSAILRNINPIDQPHVEASKKLSFEYRKRYKKN